MKILRRIALWLVWDFPINLGRLAPWLFDFGMGQKGRRKKSQSGTDNCTGEDVST